VVRASGRVLRSPSSLLDLHEGDGDERKHPSERASSLELHGLRLASRRLGRDVKPLRWIGGEDGKVGIPACDECRDYLLKMPPEDKKDVAAAGREEGKSPQECVRELVNWFHAAHSPTE
jgi:hypothetical protein